jgi:PKD repeat protein
LGLCSALSAQTVQTFPNTLPATFVGNSWPWNNTTAAGFRTQFIYDASNLGSTSPVLIQRLRFTRSTPTATTTGLLNGVTLSISTCPVAWNALSSTWTNQIGADVKVIFQGNLSFNATQWYVDLQLASPFLWDPAKGGLCFDFVRGSLTGNTYPGPGGYATGTAATPFKANRVFGDPNSPTGSLDSATTAANGYANAVEVTWIPASGLYSNFTATPTSGPGPLQVKFTDATYTSNPPVTSWAWDFNGDNQIDSTVQNPTFTYPKTTWDAQYDVTLTTTDGTNPPSKVTKKAFITVDPSNATAVDFGAGSTIPPVPGPIKLPAFANLYTSTAIRGLYFQAPTTFIITGLRVPPDSTLPQQTVSLFTMPARPPAYSATYTVTAADQKFFTSTAAANTIIPMTPPIIIQKDTWVGVLGAGYSGTGTTVSTSYATPNGPFLTSIASTPVTLYRLLMQGTPTPFITNLGLGPVSSEDAFQIGRVEIFVVGNFIVPLMTTIGRPALGQTATLNMQANIVGAQGGLIFMTAGRLPTPVPTPYGNLLVQLPIYLSVFVPNGTGQLPVPIPNDPGLTGLLLDFQGMAFNLTSNTFGMTNGTEWFLGK